MKWMSRSSLCVVITEQCHLNLSEVRLIFSRCIVTDTVAFRALITDLRERKPWKLRTVRSLLISTVPVVRGGFSVYSRCYLHAYYPCEWAALNDFDMSRHLRCRMDNTDTNETLASAPDNAELLATASCSASGDVTIPDKVRDKLGLSPPGRVAFYESDSGEILVRRVPSASEMRGFVARNAETKTETPASELLRAKRNSDQRERE